MSFFRRHKMPRWAAVALFSMQIILWYAAAPAGFAELTSRIGWKNGRPGTVNLLGLALLVPSFLCLGWCVYLHFARSRAEIEVPETAPPYLLSDGPYRWSRNPMYVAGVAAWLGWALFYGSATVLAVALLFWSALAFLAIPYEERHLEARWGEPYHQYKRAVPRWLGATRKGETEHVQYLKTKHP